MQIIPVFARAKRSISVHPAVAGSASSLSCWAVSIGGLFLQQNYSFQLWVVPALFQRSVPSLLKYVILEQVAVHLEEVEVSCSRQRNGYWTKPNLERETTTLSSHRFLAQLFHPGLASDTGALGMLGEDPLGEKPQFPVSFWQWLCSAVVACSPSPGKERKTNQKRQTKWTGSARRELRDVVHSLAPEGTLQRVRVWEKTAYTDTEKISIKLRVGSSHSNFAVF